MRARTIPKAISATILVATVAWPSVAADPPVPAAGFEFVATGRLHEPRIHATATLLRDGRVVVIGGYEVASAEVWDPRTGEWTVAGSMAGPRESATATLLADGRVVVSGGHRDGEDSPPAEVWDPVTGTFRLAGTLADDLPRQPAGSAGLPYREGASQTTLPDGRVLVAGGRGPSTEVPGQSAVRRTGPPLRPAELWDPATGTSISLPAMVEPRTEHTATLLPDGRVLLVGSHEHGPADATAELFQPKAADVAQRDIARALEPNFGAGGHTATLLPDGRVLIVGGGDVEGREGGRVETGAQLFDPASRSFTETGSPWVPRSHHSATLLLDGRVLIVGGAADSVGTTTGTAEIWDATDETFHPAGELARPRMDHTATLLPDGRVLVIGGSGERAGTADSAELWDPDEGTFRPAGSLTEGRWLHTATLLPDGDVLVLGGRGRSFYDEYLGLAAVERWNAETEDFVVAGRSEAGRAQHTATMLPDGDLLIVGGGGFPNEQGLASAEHWDHETDTYVATSPPAVGRAGHTATLLDDGRVLVIGGYGGPGERGIGMLEAWDPETHAFGFVGTTHGYQGHSATLLRDGRVLVVGPYVDEVTFTCSRLKKGSFPPNTPLERRCSFGSYAPEVRIGSDLIDLE